jgi:hypothetical protein
MLTNTNLVSFEIGNEPGNLRYLKSICAVLIWLQIFIWRMASEVDNGYGSGMVLLKSCPLNVVFSTGWIHIYTRVA